MKNGEIVKLSRRFHELGGNEEIMPKRGMWFIDNRNGVVDLVTYYDDKFVYCHQPLFSWMRNKLESWKSISIPMHDADWLWEWLDVHTRKLTMDGTLIYIVFGEKRPFHERWTNPKEGLTRALYAAAVQVLEWEKKHEMGSEMNENHNIG